MTLTVLDDEAAIAAAVDVGKAAARLTTEEAGYLIGSTYAAILPESYRGEHGVFYTPPEVAARLLDAAAETGINWTTCHVLDPACGGGAFLGPVAARMIAAMKGCTPRVVVRNIATRLRGYEIDPFAAWISHVFLDATLYEKLNCTRLEPFEAIDVCDSLTKLKGRTFDLVIGNPPYGRVSLPAEAREPFRRSLYGHANLYGIFLDLAVRWAGERGVVAYVTPTSMLSGEYYKNLRALLAEEAAPVSINFVVEREGVFDDALQETILAVYRKGHTSNRVAVHFIEAKGTQLRLQSAGDVDLPKEATSPWILPRSTESVALTETLRGMPTRLADWGYTVRTGPLVWNRHKPQLRWKESKATIPLVWAESVSPDGEFAFRAARRNHAPFFAVEKGDEALLVKEPCVLLQRTTSKEQPRRLIAAELPETFIAQHGGAVVVENHLNMIVPLVAAPKIDTATLAAFLNTGAADKAFRCINGSVAVSAFELEAMPLPGLVEMKAVSKAVRAGASRSEIEKLCSQLYA